jgi:hypothetical protein
MLPGQWCLKTCQYRFSTFFQDEEGVPTNFGQWKGYLHGLHKPNWLATCRQLDSLLLLYWFRLLPVVLLCEVYINRLCLGEVPHFVSIRWSLPVQQLFSLLYSVVVMNNRIIPNNRLISKCSALLIPKPNVLQGPEPVHSISHP